MTVIWKMFRSLLGGAITHDDAWRDDPALHSPREAMLHQIARVLQIGAGLHGLLISLILLISLASQQVAGIAGILATQASEDFAIVIGITLLMANLSFLLVLAVGVQAQEFWALVASVIHMILNILAIFLLGYWPGLLAVATLAYALWLASHDWRAFHTNPVMAKELRGRMRGVRAFAIITIFLTLMGSFTVLLYLLQLPRITGGITIITGELGRLLFAGVVGIELVLAIFIIPALTAGSVTGERERKTYDLLQTTLLSAPAFVVGKMESALGYIFLLLLSAIPLQSIAFLFGGVSEVEIILALLILIATGLLLGAMGLFFSSQTDRTLTATVRVYTTAIALLIAIPLVSLIVGNPFGQAVEGIGLQNMSPTGEITAVYGDLVLASLNPISAAYYSQRILINTQTFFLFEVELRSGGTIPVIAPWALLTILYTGIAAFLILLAMRRMRQGGAV